MRPSRIPTSLVTVSDAVTTVPPRITMSKRVVILLPLPAARSLGISGQDRERIDYIIAGRSATEVASGGHGGRNCGARTDSRGRMQVKVGVGEAGSRWGTR